MRKWALRLLLLPVFLLRDLWRRLGGTGQKARPLRQTSFPGGPIAILATYQSGQMRPDLLRLMLALRRQGVYLLVVNAAQLADGGARLPADCYLERRNFGRDFGSYRRGIALLAEQGWRPSRLLLLNDSVFYAGQGLEVFLRRLLDSPADVCSATESRELLPHQTSFCLSFSARCLADKGFQRFWRRYICSDLRPATVLLGEIALSRRLARRGMGREVLASHASLLERIAPEAQAAAPSPRALGNSSHLAPGHILDLGVPVIKLDLLRRAELSPAQIDALQARLPPSDGDLFRGLMTPPPASAPQQGRLERLGSQVGLA